MQSEKGFPFADEAYFRRFVGSGNWVNCKTVFTYGYPIVY
ncbi:hypothetical protein NEIFLAOT_02305 [Neisseria flavescens NRL30031/H210]|uniref:Uncharacterized protein n=1 Tax=Neisseria flavescens NRL30031/H210 TaxID=546264 RepID=C0EQR1_NEIFL|nr:hypothetical protein NEIFLAOT_02305 [Neisseria flavescens NRL30031/H210]